MVGIVPQMVGPVIDVEFPSGNLPKIYIALKIKKKNAKEIIIAEAQYLIGENKVRALYITSTDR